nr:lamin tail domain-containing protein [Bacteroidales bacterium]
MKKLIIASLAAVLALTACVKDNVYPYASVADMANTIALNEATDVEVSATVTALVKITKVNLVYTVGSEEPVTVEMTANGNVYTATIPAQAMDAVVKYYIETITEGGTSQSAEGTYTVGVNPIDYTPLKLSELNGNDKFIEIVNTGSKAINIKGIKLFKDTKDVWTGPDKELAAGAYLLLYSTDVVAPTDGSDPIHPEYVGTGLVFDSGLSAKKNVSIVLATPVKATLDYFNLTGYAEKCAASY